ncbi:protein-ADP-ribose hydrolase [Streptomyces viridochromogenes]|uniref:protein-ADP-ribose hydrolase n=1 Tax=Streptomyces viridochromogenes TaxID=1938 RepID=UPI00069F3488|nr:protein-ADP-ribose hydrolase [Streptomyces viridochromogenes]KOG09542.1 Appr-1-p processing protein [Streptomyces viridochromogenes]KOG09881.1 Appr-1-p processing protein [Streptomyces viridochromogenes]
MIPNRAESEAVAGTETQLSALPLTAYRSAVALDEPFLPTAPPATAARLDAHVRSALHLLSADPAVSRLGLRSDSLRHLADADTPADADTARRVLRALLTGRDPGPLPKGADLELDALLGAERNLRPTVSVRELPTIEEEFHGTASRAAAEAVLWRGDITTLAADAVVNAANSQLLGCFRPLHPCIDNALHNAAGPHLRDDCHTIITAQGALEPTGTAKITRGYHLPARYVLHTVGPVVQGRPHAHDAQALASSYRACLDLAAEVETIRTLAFCAVSTGVFGYPKEEAAPVALHTVADWIAAHPGRFDRVVFTVFEDDDERAYHQALCAGARP